MKKLLFFHHSESIGGAGISGLNMLGCLNSNDYDITVYCTSNDNYGMADLFQEKGYNVIRAGKSPAVLLHFSGSEKFIFSPYFLRCIKDIILDVKVIREVLFTIQPDIVVLNSMSLFWIAPLAKKMKSDVVLFFRETYTRGLLGVRTQIIKRFLNKYVDKISFISTYEKNKSKSVKSYKKVIYNIFDPQIFEGMTREECRNDLGLSNDHIYILFLGGMIPYKGALYALKALKNLQNINVKLLFIGHSWNGQKISIKNKKGVLRKIHLLLNLNYEANCVNYILKNKLEEQVLFYPLQMNIAPFYKAADVLIFPMTKPHQARPIIEAGFAKIPVVITDFPQIREFCDTKTSYLFKNRDVNMLTLKLQEVITNNSINKLLIDQNYNQVLNKHSYTKYKKDINALFDFKINNK